jgi:hypothetical protein
MTGGSFVISTPQPDNHMNRGHPVWFATAPDAEEFDKTAYCQSAWRDNGGTIWLESTPIGNTSDWIEESYGEEAVFPITGMDLTHFSEARFREEFLKSFPDLKGRLGSCEAILDSVSKKHKTKLEIRFDGGKGLAFFYIDARVEAVPSMRLVIKRIENALKALKEAYDQMARV